MTKELSTKDICKLISVCKSSGVTEFKFGELSFSLVKTAPAKRVSPAAIPEQVNQNDKLVSDDSERARVRLAQEKEDTALLILEDPLEMERKIASGELIDEATDDR